MPEQTTVMRSEAIKAWLEAHPTRSRDWLDRIISDGFDIHHIDKDDANNDPNNLLLVETYDHEAILHGKKVSFTAISAKVERRTQQRLARLTKGEKAYQIRQLSLAWSEIDAFLKITASNMYARQFALSIEAPWPLPFGRVSWARRGTVRDQVRNNIEAISAILGREADPNEISLWYKKDGAQGS